MSAITLNALKDDILADNIILPGSKSISNRVLLIASLRVGITIIENLPCYSEDVRIMYNALIVLGVKIDVIASDTNSFTCKVYGCAGKFFNNVSIDCVNSGTTLRFLCAVLALTGGSYQLLCDSRMSQRPIKELVTALSTLGANIQYDGESGFPPLKIYPCSPIIENNITISGSISSQYISGLLIAFYMHQEEFIICPSSNTISYPYIKMTITILRYFGMTIYNNRDKIVAYNKHNSTDEINYVIEPDLTAASYFFAMGALGGCISCRLPCSSIQGDYSFINILSRLGAIIWKSNDSIFIRKNNLPLNGISINMCDTPDIAITLAVIALRCIEEVYIYGVASLRIKESDRLLALAIELLKFGASIELTLSSIRIIPPKIIKNNIIVNTYNDHRIAMSFALVCFMGKNVTINDVECTAKTFANYFTMVKQIVNL